METQTRAAKYGSTHSRTKRAEPAPGCQECEYWKRQMKRAASARDEIKASMEAADGPSAHWRREAKKAKNELQRYMAAVNGQSAQVRPVNDRSTESDGKLETVKHQLWEIWTGLSDDAPIKVQLWDVWTQL